MFKKIFILLTFIIVILIVQEISVQALTIYDDFSASSNWQFNGSAYWYNNEAILTKDYTRLQRGSLWYTTSFDLSLFQYFTVDVKIYLGSRDSGADGITFAVIDSSNGLGALGGIGGWLGYQVINDSFAVEIDTYWNNGIDPLGFQDHIGIDVNGSVHSLTTADISNIENGQWHTLKVEFDILHSIVSVWLDNTKKIDNYNISIDMSGKSVYFGFTGSTGGQSNLQKIDDFQLNLTPKSQPVPEPSTIFLVSIGAMGIIWRRRKTS